jgi:hypothetical protein
VSVIEMDVTQTPCAHGSESVGVSDCDCVFRPHLNSEYAILEQSICQNKRIWTRRKEVLNFSQTGSQEGKYDQVQRGRKSEGTQEYLAPKNKLAKPGNPLYADTNHTPPANTVNAVVLGTKFAQCPESRATLHIAGKTNSGNTGDAPVQGSARVSVTEIAVTQIPPRMGPLRFSPLAAPRTPR